MKKKFALLLLVSSAAFNFGFAQQNTIAINSSAAKYIINKNIYGHFAEHLGHCIYDGFYVGDTSKIPNTNGVRNDIIAALKKLKIPNLRWPGGCFADTYHWKDGIGPMKHNEVRGTKFTTDNLRFLYLAPANEEYLYSVLTKWSVLISEYGIALNSNKETKRRA